MFKKLLNTKVLKNQKGLTLIELLAVIVILAIIAAIAIPAIGNIIQNSRDKAVLSDASNLLAGAKIAITENACGAAVSNVITCDDGVLADYFEGTLGTNDQVTFNTSTRDYEITYAEFANIENTTRFGTGLGANDITMTEDQLIGNLD